MANKFFPVSIDLNDKNILVIGAGKISLRKIETLLKYNCNITVITKEVLEEKFFDLEKDDKIKILKYQEFEEKFLENILENILDLGIVRKKFEYYKCRIFI
mgnify:CR=1 FL=1